MAEYGIGQRHRGSGVTMPGIAGETVTRGAVVYMSAVDGLWYLADSDAVATLPTVGVISDAGTAGNVIQILTVGIIGRSDWTWTRGDTLYTSGVAGAMTQVAPANAQPVAVALTATLIYVNTTLSTVGGGGVTHDFRYLYSMGDNDQAGVNAPVAGRVYLRPIQFLVPMTIDRLVMMISVANGNGRMAIYEDGGDTPAGGALVIESASIALVINVLELPITSTAIAPPGLYWIANQFDDVTARPYREDQFSYIALPGGTLRLSFYNRAGGYGAFTDPCPAITGSQNYPWLMAARIASVP